jgi:wobble nucleotide-excising tRNase
MKTTNKEGNKIPLTEKQYLSDTLHQIHLQNANGWGNLWIHIDEKITEKLQPYVNYNILHKKLEILEKKKENKTDQETQIHNSTKSRKPNRHNIQSRETKTP